MTVEDKEVGQAIGLDLYSIHSTGRGYLLRQEDHRFLPVEGKTHLNGFEEVSIFSEK